MVAYLYEYIRRLRGLSEDGDELNPKLGELVKTLTDVDLTDANGEFRSTYEIIRDISNVWDTLNSKEQSLLLEEVAGKNQANVLSSILKNSESLTESYDDLRKAAGSAALEQEAYMDSIAGKVNALQENVRGIFYNLIDSDSVKGTLDVVNGLVVGFRGLTDVFGTLPTIVGAGTFAFAAFSEKGRELSSTIKDGVEKSLTDMGFSINGLSSEIDGIKKKIENKREAIRESINTQKTYIATNKATGVSINANRLSLVKLTAQEALATAGMYAMEVAAIALNAALTAGISLAITGLITLCGNLFSSMTGVSEKSKELAHNLEAMKDSNNLLDRYEEVNKKLEQTNLAESDRNELNKELADLKKDLSGIDDGAYAILNNTNLSYERQLQLLREIQDAKLKDSAAELEKNMSGGFFGRSEESKAKQAAADIELVLERYKELQKLQSESTDGSVIFEGIKYSAAQVTETIKNQEKILSDSLSTIDNYNSRVKLMKDSGYETSMSTVEVSKSISEQVEAIINSSSATSENTQILDENALALEGVANSADSTKTAIEKLSDTFGAMTGPISMLKDMIDEFSKYGGLTDKTYDKVLSSGNSQLIALLADADNFLSNAEALLGRLEEEQANTAKNLIDTSAREQGIFQDVIESAGEAAEAVTESMNAQAQAISGGTTNNSIEQLQGEYDSLIETVLTSLNLTGMAAKNMEAVILESIKNYVEQGNELYTQDLANSMSVIEAKNMASEMWANDEIGRLAETILAFKDQYDTDMVNWANDVVNKQTDNKTYTDTVLNQIAEMITLNAQNYNDDTVNWASAMLNKSKNNVDMVNNVIQNIAKMILANSQNYSSDTVNWANAIVDKSTNNADFCNNITNSMSDVINNLSTQYETDDQNFANLMSSKKKSLADFMKASLVEARFGNLPSFQKFLGATKKPLQNNSGGFDTSTVVGTYSGQTVAPVQVSGGNYVSKVGDPEKDKKKEKKEKKDVADLERLSDRYYAVNNALKKVENQLKAVDTELSSAVGKDRIALLEKEIKLLNDKRFALINVRSEQQNELAELRRNLSSQGFAFGSDGQISNYAQNVDRLVANANSQTGEAKEKAIASVKEIVKQLNTYTDLLLKDIPDITNQIDGITSSITDIREEIDEVIKSTTFFTKDFVDRYYELNNALQKVENELNAISTAMKNADDNRMVELLDKQIELYVKQGEALAAIRKENVAELRELERELYTAGFRFNKDGTLSNYQSLIDKMVQDANKITDGKKQEKAIERINELMETIEKYTDLLLTDIPNITDEMDDLANSVIDSQKEIASILAKQREEYVDNLKKETDVLKKEIERRKDIIQKQWEKEDAEDELAEKQKALNELEDELAIALRVGDEELVKNIREQIANAQKEINDFIRDQERDYISDRFDEDLDKIDEDLEQKIENITEKLSDEELLKLVQSGVRDLTGVLNNIEKGSKGVKTAFAAVGTTISETWIGALDTFVDKLNSLSDINLGLNVKSSLANSMNTLGRTLNITQGDFIIQGNMTEDILPVVENMINVANNNLINDINAAFSR